MSTPELDIFHGLNDAFNDSGGLGGLGQTIFGVNPNNLPGAPAWPFGGNDDGNESRTSTTPKNMQQIKNNLLNPALTSHYGVSIGLPPGVQNMISGIGDAGSQQAQLNLMCTEAVLPGSNLATMQINNNYTGVTERHAYRRVFDDRINLTFYVDAQNYLPIRVFEAWQSYIMNEHQDLDTRNNAALTSNYNYRLRYPDSDSDVYGDGEGYRATGLTVTKFERDYMNSLTYTFVKSYPISINSMPVSYDTSNLLKCTVSLTYLRYVVTQTDEFRATASVVKRKGPYTGGESVEHYNSATGKVLGATSSIGPVLV